MVRVLVQLLGAGALIVALSAPAQAQLRICNDTAINASIAIGYLGGDQWTSEGWWNAGAGQCVTVVDAPPAQSYYYWHAVNENGEFASDNYYFCAVDDVFTIVGDTDCEARGHNRISFSEIQIGANGAAEVRLTAALAPKAPAARKTPDVTPQATPEPDAQVSETDETTALAVAAPEPEQQPQPAESAAVTSALDTSSLPKPTLSLDAEIPVEDLLTKTPLDFTSIIAALQGDWTPDDNPDQISRLARATFEDFENDVITARGAWRLAAFCPGFPGQGAGVIVTYEDKPQEPRCLVIQDLSQDAFTLRDPARDALISYTRQ